MIKPVFMRTGIYIAIGSNLPEPYGSPLQNCQKSVEILNQHHIKVTKHSSWYQTVAEPDPTMAPYINGVVEVETDFQPQQLLNQLLRIEELFGRVRKKRNDPRCLDLDLLAYNQLVIKESLLELPHPRISGRIFVLRPWDDINPLWTHPILGKTVREMLEDYQNNQFFKK